MACQGFNKVRSAFVGPKQCHNETDWISDVISLHRNWVHRHQWLRDSQWIWEREKRDCVNSSSKRICREIDREIDRDSAPLWSDHSFTLLSLSLSLSSFNKKDFSFLLFRSLLLPLLWPLKAPFIMWFIP